MDNYLKNLRGEEIKKELDREFDSITRKLKDARGQVGTFFLLFLILFFILFLSRNSHSFHFNFLCLFSPFSFPQNQKVPRFLDRAEKAVKEIEEKLDEIFLNEKYFGIDSVEDFLAENRHAVREFGKEVHHLILADQIGKGVWDAEHKLSGAFRELERYGLYQGLFLIYCSYYYVLLPLFVSNSHLFFTNRQGSFRIHSSPRQRSRIGRLSP